jgi:hypothetical protein
MWAMFFQVVKKLCIRLLESVSRWMIKGMSAFKVCGWHTTEIHIAVVEVKLVQRRIEEFRLNESESSLCK